MLVVVNIWHKCTICKHFGQVEALKAWQVMQRAGGMDGYREGGKAATAPPHLSAASKVVHHAGQVQVQTGAPAAVRPLQRCDLHHSPGRPTAVPAPRVHSTAALLAEGGLLAVAGSAGRPPPAHMQDAQSHHRLLVRE